MSKIRPKQIYHDKLTASWLSNSVIGFLQTRRNWQYRSGTFTSKSFVTKVLLRIKWKFELTVHFKHEMLGK